MFFLWFCVLVVFVSRLVSDIVIVVCFAVWCAFGTVPAVSAVSAVLAVPGVYAVLCVLCLLCAVCLRCLCLRCFPSGCCIERAVLAVL